MIWMKWSKIKDRRIDIFELLIICSSCSGIESRENSISENSLHEFPKSEWMHSEISFSENFRNLIFGMNAFRNLIFEKFSEISFSKIVQKSHFRKMFKSLRFEVFSILWWKHFNVREIWICEFFKVLELIYN